MPPHHRKALQPKAFARLHCQQSLTDGSGLVALPIEQDDLAPSATPEVELLRNLLGGDALHPLEKLTLATLVWSQQREIFPQAPPKLLQTRLQFGKLLLRGSPEPWINACRSLSVAAGSPIGNSATRRWTRTRLGCRSCKVIHALKRLASTRYKSGRFLRRRGRRRCRPGQLRRNIFRAPVDLPHLGEFLARALLERLPQLSKRVLIRVVQFIGEEAMPCPL
mmetsp:Transcript_115984/g.247907  ORF Transcript_115984/g.247907 Transcript_115984/m.247907 type:complete len:222 (+) Transcript_115984:903-1568(+)